MWKKGLAAVLIAAAGMGLMAGCGSDKAASSGSKEPIKVGTSATYVPFEFKSKDSDEFQGYEIELTKALAKEMGRDVQFKNLGFDGLIPALLSHEIDMSVSGMTITAPRAEKILFSAPDYQTTLYVLTKKDGPIKNAEDLNKGQIAVQMATTAATYATEKGLQVKTLDNSSEVIMDLHAGNSQAAILDKPVVEYFLKTGDSAGFTAFEVPGIKAQYFGMGFNKDNGALQKEVNAALAKLKKDGTLNKIHQKWFGSDAPDMPASAEEALK